ncbi:MAG: hypothetical protein COB15_10985 [Flavobacteriales bacterium]|nr:MAG: hypothetical protein COB15_10985 [Flavobacteriales bacterium]
MINRILILLIGITGLGVNSYSQSQKEITRKEFLENMVIVDTIPEEWNYSPNQLKIKSVLVRVKLSKEENETYSIYHKKEKYLRSGKLKKVSYYNLGQMTEETVYNKKGTKKWIYKYRYKKPEEILVYITDTSIKGKYSLDYTVFTYKKDKLVSKESYLNLRRHGVNEHYNSVTGEIEKRVTYKKGKKQDAK